MNPDCYISAAELNALRRDCINEMLNMYHVRNTVPVFDETAAANVRNIRITADRQVYSAGFLYARVSNVMAAEAAAKAGAEFIAFEPCTFDDNATQINGLLKLREKFANGQRLILALPNVIITENSINVSDCLLNQVLLMALKQIISVKSPSSIILKTIRRSAIQYKTKKLQNTRSAWRRINSNRRHRHECNEQLYNEMSDRVGI